MVIPMPADPIQGPPPPEVAGQFKWIKYAVLVMLGCTIGRLFSAMLLLDPLHGLMICLNLILITVMGVFLMKDDTHLKPVHFFMVTRCCTACAEQSYGGMNCLLPFCVCNLVTLFVDLLGNSFAGLIKMLPVVFDPKLWPSKLGGVLLSVYCLSTLFSYLAQLVGCIAGYQAYTKARDMLVGRGLTPGGGGGYAPPAYQPAPSGSAPASSSRPSRAPGQQTFKPFSGTGQRLGG